MNNKIFFILLFFLGVACKDEPPVKDDGKTLPPPTNPLQLTVEDVTCTEAFLKLSLASSEENRTVTLKRNDAIIFSDLRLPTSDTLVIDEGLLPNKTYTYKLVYGDWDTTTIATTMDTTSHDWSWEITTLGDGGSSLYDVAIINDTLAYAVGEIHIGDSLYNVAKWDGKNWELLRLKWNCRVYYPNCGPVTQLFSPATAVFAFGPDDVWIAAGSVHHFNGTQWSEEGGIQGAGSANKIWGDKTAGLYFVGTNGFIVHRSISGSWQSMGSGTALALTDIHGTYSGEIYACGINYNQSKGIILKKSTGNWSTFIEGDIIDSVQLFNPKLFGITKGIWIDEKNSIYSVGNLMYQYRFNRWSLVKSLAGNNFTGNPSYLHRGFLHAIDGNATNDFFIVGEINTIRHFNGTTWQQIGLPYQPLNYGMFWLRCAVKNDLMIAVGKNDGRASIITAKRK